MKAHSNKDRHFCGMLVKRSTRHEGFRTQRGKKERDIPLENDGFTFSFTFDDVEDSNRLVGWTSSQSFPVIVQLSVVLFWTNIWPIKWACLHSVQEAVDDDQAAEVDADHMNSASKRRKHGRRTRTYNHVLMLRFHWDSFRSLGSLLDRVAHELMFVLLGHRVGIVSLTIVIESVLFSVWMNEWVSEVSMAFNVDSLGEIYYVRFLNSIAIVTRQSSRSQLSIIHPPISSS